MYWNTSVAIGLETSTGSFASWASSKLRNSILLTEVTLEDMHDVILHNEKRILNCKTLFLTLHDRLSYPLTS
jgi:hypothetical protein